MDCLLTNKYKLPDKVMQDNYQGKHFKVKSPITLNNKEYTIPLTLWSGLLGVWTLTGGLSGVDCLGWTPQTLRGRLPGVDFGVTP